MCCTRAQGKAYDHWNKQAVFIADPPASAPAALVLLAQSLRILDKSIYTHARMLRLRYRWMRERMKTPDVEGGLTCAMCGKTGLNPFTQDLEKLATLDHIRDIREGGIWNHPNNFQVACWQCNQSKSR